VERCETLMHDWSGERRQQRADTTAAVGSYAIARALCKGSCVRQRIDPIAKGPCWWWPWRGCPTRAAGTHSASAPTIWTTDVPCPFDPRRYVELPAVWAGLGRRARGRHAAGGWQCGGVSVQCRAAVQVLSVRERRTRGCWGALRRWKRRRCACPAASAYHLRTSLYQR
jgi:hypothetical protein